MKSLCNDICNDCTLQMVAIWIYSVCFCIYQFDTNTSTTSPWVESTPAVFGASCVSFTETPGRSLYIPSDMEISFDCSPGLVQTESSKEKLNAFLSSRDISPVRTTLSTEWSEASERTQRRHVRKAKQAMVAVLDEVAPNQSSKLWDAVMASPPFSGITSHKNDVDEVFMQNLSECYDNGESWKTRRQILSIVAESLSYDELKKWIPDLTHWHFKAARKHAKDNGKGVPVAKKTQTRMYVSPAQVNHFLGFITSPHIVQDLPFGEKTIKLSSKSVVKIPNVIRVMIPEQIVKQYLTYAEESNFKALSRSTLLRILSVCSASTRKSLQGLDYISAAGAQAFEDLSEITEQLGEYMGMSWASEQDQRLKSAKRYLKTDYKVCRGNA